MLSNLLLYELILIITGSILFLALVFAFIWYVIKNKSIMSLLPFFIIPIAMIAWPTINSISYENGKVEIQKLAQEVKAAPADSIKRAELEKALEKISKNRSEDDVQALIYRAEAQSALGNYDAAEQIINKALMFESENGEAIQVKKKILEQKEVQANFNQDVIELQENLSRLADPAYTSTTGDFDNISEILTNLKVPVYTDEASLITVSKALSTVDEKETSMSIAEKVIEANPASESAKEVKTDIETGKLKPIRTQEGGAEIKNPELKNLDKVVIQSQRMHQ